MFRPPSRSHHQGVQKNLESYKALVVICQDVVMLLCVRVYFAM